MLPLLLSHETQYPYDSCVYESSEGLSAQCLKNFASMTCFDSAEDDTTRACRPFFLRGAEVGAVVDADGAELVAATMDVDAAEVVVVKAGAKLAWNGTAVFSHLEGGLLCVLQQRLELLHMAKLPDVEAAAAAADVVVQHLEAVLHCSQP
jgi:hypothetical protein